MAGCYVKSKIFDDLIYGWPPFNRQDTLYRQASHVITYQKFTKNYQLKFSFHSLSIWFLYQFRKMSSYCNNKYEIDNTTLKIIFLFKNTYCPLQHNDFTSRNKAEYAVISGSLLRKMNSFPSKPISVNNDSSCTQPSAMLKKAVI